MNSSVSKSLTCEYFCFFFHHQLKPLIIKKHIFSWLLWAHLMDVFPAAFSSEFKPASCEETVDQRWSRRWLCPLRNTFGFNCCQDHSQYFTHEMKLLLRFNFWQVLPFLLCEIEMSGISLFIHPWSWWRVSHDCLC